MPAQKGRDLLLKIGDGGAPETFATLGGLRPTSLTINQEAVDVTSKDDAGVRTLLADAGVFSMSISAGGVFVDDAAWATFEVNVRGKTIDNYQIVVPDYGTYEGAFLPTSLEYAGEYNGEVTYSLSMESSGAVTFT